MYTLEHPREIIILAMGPSRGQCPFDAETYALNMGYLQALELKGRLDKIFLVHKQVISPSGTVYFHWGEFIRLAEAGVELWNIHEINCERCDTHIPFKKYPLDEIIEKFDLGYFSDTVCYQIAFALNECTEGNHKDHTLKLKYPLKLKLYGVDLQDKEEYGMEKGGVECWIGYALGLGVDISISTGSTLLLTNNGLPYGFDCVDYNYLNPYKVLGGAELTEEQFKERIHEVAEAQKRIAESSDPRIVKYRGECAKGLHRESKLPTVDEERERLKERDDNTKTSTE